MKHLFLLATVLALSFHAFAQSVSSTAKKSTESTVGSRQSTTTQQRPIQSGTSIANRPNGSTNVTQVYSSQNPQSSQVGQNRNTGTFSRTTATNPAGAGKGQTTNQSGISSVGRHVNGTTSPQSYVGQSTPRRPQTTSQRGTTNNPYRSTTGSPMRGRYGTSSYNQPARSYDREMRTPRR